MRKILAAWDEHLADPHLPRRLTSLLNQAGFAVTHRSAIPLFNARYDPRTYSADYFFSLNRYLFLAVK
jgi:arsenite methyltransferase